MQHYPLTVYVSLPSSGVPIKQRGAALIIALIMLLAITLLGVSSLRSGIFHERMSLNSQADALTFMGAESAINALYSKAASNDGDAFFADTLISGQPQFNCVAKTGILTAACTSNAQALDSRPQGVLLAEAKTRFIDSKRVLNSDQSYMSYYRFSSEGVAYFDQALKLPFANKNAQEWQKQGVSTGFSVSNADMLSAVGN